MNAQTSQTGSALSSAPSMRKRARTWHKWVGLVVGLAMAIWVISGMVMITPGAATAWSKPHAPPPHQAYLVSPARAIAAANGAASAIVVLKPFGNQPMLQVQHGGGRHTMVHGVTGEILTVTRENAAWLALGDSSRASEAIEVPGPPPMWRFPLNEAGSFVQVDPADAGVTLSTKAQRWRAYIFSLHTFIPLRDIIGHRQTRWLLWGLSLLSMVTVLTGYWLILPKRRARRASPSP